MKAICLIVLFVSVNSYAQSVRENVKVKQRTQIQTRHVPEKFEDVAKVSSSQSASPKKTPPGQQKKK